MWSAEKIGLYLAGLFAAVVAYHKGYMAALAEVKANNAKKQEEYAKKKQEVDALSDDDFVEQLRNGKRDF